MFPGAWVDLLQIFRQLNAPQAARFPPGRGTGLLYLLYRVSLRIVEVIAEVFAKSITWADGSVLLKKKLEIYGGNKNNH